MANVYAVALSILGIVVAHACLLVWLALLLPGPVERARRHVEARPVLCLFVGIICTLVTIGLLAGFSVLRAPLEVRVDQLQDYLSAHLQFNRFYNDTWIIINGLVWIIAGPMLVAWIFGGAGIAQLFAIRARPLMRDDRPLVGLTCGAFCTAAAYFLPLIGWFIYLPVVGLISIGAGILGVCSRAEPRQAEARPATARRQEPSLSSP